MRESGSIIPDHSMIPNHPMIPDHRMIRIIP
jgi:hypothetical protein